MKTYLLVGLALLLASCYVGSAFAAEGEKVESVSIS